MKESCDYCAIRGCEGECRKAEKAPRPRKRAPSLRKIRKQIRKKKTER